MLAAFAILGLAAADSPGSPEPSATFNGGKIYREQSLTKPFFAGDGISIPNWDFIGNTVVTDDYIRLTPDRQTKKGAVWGFKPMPDASWEMTAQFKVSGQGTSMFGDGFALWYTKERNNLGSALGNVEQFNGLGIFFDTYDNHQEDHGHPWVAAIQNDGTKVYDHDEDGKSHTEGGCQSFFRNLDHPTFVRATYWEHLKFLKVQIDTKEDQAWTDCFHLTNIHLPSGYYFGASASTGDLADNHDIVSIKVGEAPFPTQEIETLAKEAKEAASKQIGSMEQGKQMNQHHMDNAKVHSNHHERHPDQEEDSEEGGMGIMGWIFVLVLIVAAAVGGFYFFTKEDTKKFRY